MAKYVTLWAALTAATPESSCLHFVPRKLDPGYQQGDPEEGDPLQRIFQDKASFPDLGTDLPQLSMYKPSSNKL